MFVEDGFLEIVDTIDEIRTNYEGIDVESGVYEFFDENGNEDTDSKRETHSEDLRNNGSLRFRLDKKLNDKGRNLRLRSEISLIKLTF